MHNKFAPSSITEYFTWIFNQYYEIQKQSQISNAYRIVEINEKKDGGCQFTIQVIGKNLTFKTTARKLAADDKMLESFSRQDVRTITYFACQEINEPKYKIMVKEFCAQFNRIIFSLIKRDSNKTVQKTADQVSIDKTFLNNLSQEDAHTVGYIAAAERIGMEESKKQEIKNNLQPQYEIKSEEYCTTFKKMIFSVKRKGSNKIKQKTAEQILARKKVLKGLKQEEAYRIGYIAGTELTATEADNKRKLVKKR